MTAETGAFDEADALFEAALDQPPPRRAALLARCADASVRARVERLLAAVERTQPPLRTAGALDGPVAGVIADALDRAGSAPPSEVGAYRLVRRIGEGGMGEVWEGAQDHPVRRRVAVKLVRRGLDGRQVLARFESERQALALMTHPCIARVLDAGATPDGRPWFAMEYCDGAPITSWCDGARLALRARLELFVAVCEGVQHAHQKGVVHRDLKPSNVLVVDEGGRPVPKIIDFGVARATHAPITDRTLRTQLGELVGTPEYMSPEQADPGSIDVDTRADVWALGVILYELVAGARPFERGGGGLADLEALLRAIRERDPPPPSARAAGPGAAEAAARRGLEPRGLARALRGDLDWITLRALAKERGRRYGSAAELAADVRRHLAVEPVLAGPPGLAYRALKLARRRRGLLAATGAVALAIAAGLVGTGLALVRARDEAERARTQAALARAVNGFLNDDLLSAVAPGELGIHTTMREVLDAAAGRVEGKFGAAPEAEAAVRHTIGRTYARMGRLERAEPHLRRALALRRERLGPDHPEALETANELGELLLARGAAADAEAVLRDTLRRRARVLGPDHAETIASLTNVGVLLLDRGALDEAEATFTDALARARRALGTDHPYALAVLHDLGALYQRAGRLGEAEVAYREAWQRTRAASGPEHPETLTSLAALGRVIRDRGRLDEAEPIYRTVLDVRRRVLGPDHPHTLTSLNNMGFLLASRGRDADAAALYREALAGARRALGPDHDQTLLAQGNLGEVLARSGGLAEALQLLSDAVRRARAAGLAADSLGSILRKEGVALAAAGRRREAERALREAHGLLAGVLGEGHAGTRRAAGDLAELYDRWGRPDDAAAWRARGPSAP